MNEQLTARYDRQIRLPQIGREGQEKLVNSHVLIIGLGGLGSPVSLYLTAAGIGKLTLVDFDVVEASNLQRQIIHREDRLGMSKVESAKQTLTEVNPHVEIVAVNAFLTESALFDLCQHVDLVIDCTDNGLSRSLINRVVMRAKKPLVSGAAIRWEGQVTVFDGREVNTPCYHCFDPLAEEGGETCDAQGVVSPLVGAIGLLQALEAFKVLIDRPSLVGEVLLFDGLTMTQRKMRLTQDPDCPVCRARKGA